MGLNDIVKKTLCRQMCLLFGPRDSFAVKWEKLSQRKKGFPFYVSSETERARLTLLRWAFYNLKD